MKHRFVILAASAVLLAACGSTTSPERETVASPSAQGTTASEAPVPEAIEGCVPACNPPVAVIYPDVASDMNTFGQHGEDVIATVKVPTTPA